MTRKPVFILVMNLILGTLAIFAPTLTRAAATAPTFRVNSPADIVASAPLDNGVCETAPGNGVCTLRAAIMKANHYPGGGGILNNGVLTLIHSTVSQNSTNSTLNTSTGGGIYNSFPLSLTIINSTINGNSANSANGIAAGGGIVGGATLINSTISGNMTSGDGGGISVTGPLLLINSTIDGNMAGQNGGGIFINGPLTLINSTVSGNHSNVNGGGIYIFQFTTSLFNATIADNLANADASGGGAGGGVYSANDTVNFQNSIIGDNNRIIPMGILLSDDCFDTLTSQGNNILSSDLGCTISGGGLRSLNQC